MTYEKGIPDYAMVPAKEIEDRVIVPITKGAIYTPVQVTNITEKPKTVITLEEDILVPDIKPDLQEILLIDGKARLSAREINQIVKGDDYINLSGEVELQTLYKPEKQEGNCPLISVQTRIPFKDQWHISPAPGSTVILDCAIDKIENMVINERKFRVKISLSVTALEYSDAKVDIFEGLFEEELQTLKEPVEISNIALRKKDTLAIKEDLHPKEDSFPETILKQDLNIVENYKQITGEKIVINGFIYVNLLYFSSPAGDSEPAASLHQLQDRVEFTQFIPLQQNGKYSGCNVSFDDSQLKVKLSQDDEGSDVFCLEGELLTYVEIYKNTEREIIVDGYHRQKDFVCEFAEENSRTLIGTSSGESSVREIISPENSSQDADAILYTGAEVLKSEGHCEQGKIISEGSLLVKIICLGTQEEQDIFTVTKELPFRTVNAMPQLTGAERVLQKIYIKDLWSEKINGKQLEFNASLMVCAEIMKEAPFKILINPAFEEWSSKREMPPMAIYICKPADTLWKIAKKFKTTIESIKNINNLDADQVFEGQKLLIIK